MLKLSELILRCWVLRLRQGTAYSNMSVCYSLCLGILISQRPIFNQGMQLSRMSVKKDSEHKTALKQNSKVYLTPISEMPHPIFGVGLKYLQSL